MQKTTAATEDIVGYRMPAATEDYKRLHTASEDRVAMKPLKRIRKATVQQNITMDYGLLRKSKEGYRQRSTILKY